MIALAGAQDLIITNDRLFVWSTASGHTVSLPSEARRARLGMQSDDQTKGGILSLEPNLRLPLYRGLLAGQRRFFCARMTDGLRVAGTVEINAADAPFNDSRTAYLTRISHDMLGNLGTADSEWLVHRPTIPDSLPVNGPSNQWDRFFWAFGHQQIGLTLGGITGKSFPNVGETGAGREN